MKIGAVSGDLVVKLALLAGAIGLAWYVYRQTAGRLSSAADSVTETVRDLVNSASEVADSVIVGVDPTNPSNWINQGVSAIGGAVVSDTGPGRSADGSWSVGAWLYDVTHDDPVTGAGTTSGGTPMVESGGAAFGWFPQLGRGGDAGLRTIAERGRVVGGL